MQIHVFVFFQRTANDFFIAGVYNTQDEWIEMKLERKAPSSIQVLLLLNVALDWSNHVYSKHFLRHFFIIEPFEHV